MRELEKLRKKLKPQPQPETEPTRKRKRGRPPTNEKIESKKCEGSKPSERRLISQGVRKKSVGPKDEEEEKFRKDYAPEDSKTGGRDSDVEVLSQQRYEPGKQEAPDEDQIPPMTTEEKAALVQSTGELYAKGGGHMYRIIQIIAKRNRALVEENAEEEMEIDFDALEPITLREIERYVTNCKRAEILSRKKRGLSWPKLAFCV